MSDLIISDALQAMIESEDIRNMARNPVKELMNLLYWSMLTCMIFMTLGLLLQLTVMSLEFDLADVGRVGGPKRGLLTFTKEEMVQFEMSALRLSIRDSALIEPSLPPGHTR
ncbi:hypothetical protein SISNIDRAFT_467118 [Sistotremastrum niveocremeum HHB9708]|uniref:Uncharacterized protein n=1 Tax=Sistotremastrum niveocremeum HHB9708 TaxID=1314777 RepID=A0A164TD54_9AGAM|nr:hypothetical protein SISNIDRAFT_467118 [Sistotremastrum niveocremeum HHB9708]